MYSNHLKIAIRFTLITTVLFGLVYPLIMIGYARVVTRSQADGQLITVNGATVGSRPLFSRTPVQCRQRV
jgi:K+-transporting ATPase ATPase C chain